MNRFLCIVAVLVSQLLPSNSLQSQQQQQYPVPSAQLSFPTAGEPGYLRMPDGQSYRIVYEPLLKTASYEGTTPGVQAGAESENAVGEGGAQKDNGTNPAQNITTFIFDNEYYTLEGNNRINTTYARFKFPTYDKRGSLLVEIPFVYYNFKATDPDLPQVGGLGDLKFQASYNTWISEDKKFTFINFLELYIPSADNTLVGRLPDSNQLTAFNLGTGKYVIGPGVGGVYAFAPNFLIAPLYFFEASIFGNSDREDIRRGKWRIFLMYAWENGLYVLPELQIVTNYLTGNNDIYVAPEMGWSYKRSTLFVKPGFGIDPDKNDRLWGIEFGARIQF